MYFVTTPISKEARKVFHKFPLPSTQASMAARARQAAKDFKGPTHWATHVASEQDFLLRFAMVFKHPRFREMNAHLTDEEYHELVDPVLEHPPPLHHPKWPTDKPVWPAHKPSTCNYVQLKVCGHNVSINILMAAFKYRFISPWGHTEEEGKEWLASKLKELWQVSHLMGGFVNCQLDMNPNNLVLEPVWMNHARKGCALRWALMQKQQAMVRREAEEERRNKSKKKSKSPSYNKDLKLEEINGMAVYEIGMREAKENFEKNKKKNKNGQFEVAMSTHCMCQPSAAKGTQGNKCKCWRWGDHCSWSMWGK